MSERTEFVGRTPAEWRAIRDTLTQWNAFFYSEGQKDPEGLDDALDLVEEIDRRFDSQR